MKNKYPTPLLDKERLTFEPYKDCSRDDLIELLLGAIEEDQEIKRILGDRHYTGHSVKEHVKDLLRELGEL